MVQNPTAPGSLVSSQGELEAAGISVTGTLDDLLRNVDVVADCALKKIAAGNMRRAPGVRSSEAIGRTGDRGAPSGVYGY